MAAKVLNKSHRETLQVLARELVRSTQDTTALDAAYEEVANIVAAVVEAKYPKADMAVLRKYDVGREDTCIYVSPGYGNIQQFYFRQGDSRVPYVPSRYCNHRTPHLMNEEQAATFDRYEALREEQKAAINRRVADFDALIAASRTFDEVAAVWPAAEQLRERICGQSRAVSIMSEDTLARLKADPAAAGAAA